MSVKPIPEGMHTVTPYLIVKGAHALIEFTKQAFGAELKHLSPTSDGHVMHALLQVGDSHIMLSDGRAEFPPMASMLHLYVPDVDGVYAKAIAAGAQSLREPENQFYGDRSAGVEAFGVQWWLATHMEDLSDEELARRAQAAGR